MALSLCCSHFTGQCRLDNCLNFQIQTKPMRFSNCQLFKTVIPTLTIFRMGALSSCGKERCLLSLETPLFISQSCVSPKGCGFSRASTVSDFFSRFLRFKTTSAVLKVLFEEILKKRRRQMIRAKNLWQFVPGI